MISPRWRKVLRDLWHNKGRTVLVVLSIAVGVFAVGTVVHMQAIIQSDMVGSYERANPASATIYTEGSFDEDLLEVVRRMPEVAAAEGMRSMIVRFQLEGDTDWYPMLLISRHDYEDMRINILQLEDRFEPEPDAWPGPVPLPPPEREVMFERTSCILSTGGLAFRAKLGDTMIVETPMGKQREMRMAGLVGDFGRVPSTFMGMAYGYVTLDTMDWLGLPRTFNELSILVSGDRQDRAYIQWVAEQVADRVERGGVTVARTEVPAPGVLPLDSLVDGMIYLLSALGILSLLSSAFLLINTVQALLTQQVQQIGVMKALGARARHIMAMYLSILLVFGALSLLIAVPLGSWVARWIIALSTYFVNFELSNLSFPLHVLALEVAMGLLVPFLAGIWPVISGTRITVREAISSYGLGEEGFGTGFIDRLMEQVRGLPRPLLLSLRNTFRRKGRLALTLTTLVLAGTLFVSVVGVRASMDRLLEDINQFKKFDIFVQFERSYRTERIEEAISSVSGVAAVENWSANSAYRLRPDGSEGGTFSVWALPAESNVFSPALVKGRWLLPEDENAIVVNTYVLEDEPDLDIDSEVVLDLDDRETTWRIVGVVQPGLPTSEAYANYSYLPRLVRQVGRASNVYIITEQHDMDAQIEVAEALQTELENTGLNVSFIQTVAEESARGDVLFNILSTLLMAMAVLLAIVGGIGLMGTMLLNVLERIREVGVMRAIGASNEAVLQIFIAEGVVIGLISWVLATILALPLGQIIGQAVGTQIWGIPLRFVFPVNGALIWLALATLLSVAASAVPAQNATRITVRDVLAYVG